MTDIKPCTVKGCRETLTHHHRLRDGSSFTCDRKDECVGGGFDYGPPVAPRLTRKALNARIAALEAENADLHAEIADKKDRLARCEKPAPVMSTVAREWSVLIDDMPWGQIYRSNAGKFATFTPTQGSFWSPYKYDTHEDALAAVEAAAREAGAL